MFKVIRTNTHNKDFKILSDLLDKELWQKYPEIHALYEAHCAVGLLQTALVGYIESKAVSCGCFLEHPGKIIEIKRMYVLKDFRGHGFSKIILTELETWAKGLGNVTSILETGSKQPEAIALYQKHSYLETESYGIYKDLPDSFCFKKSL